MTTDSGTTAPGPSKLPWAACVLTLCCPGLGHLYVGQLRRGLLLFLLSLILIPVAAFVAGIEASTVALAGLIAAFAILLGLWIFALVDACRIASRGGAFPHHEYQTPLVYGLFLAAGICSPILSAAYVRRNVLEAFYLPTKSMAPTLVEGDRILVNKTSRRLEHLGRGDVVVFRAPERRHLNFIKRIVGMPGDEVTIENGELKINGAPVVPPGATIEPEDDSGEKAGNDAGKATDETSAPPRKQTVPPGTCFVVGDNLNNSFDSRKFGPVPVGDIIGVAEYIYLPGSDWSRFGAFQ